MKIMLNSFNFEVDPDTGKCLYARVVLHGENPDSTEFVNSTIRVNNEDLPSEKTLAQVSVNDIIEIAKQKLANATTVEEK